MTDHLARCRREGHDFAWFHRMAVHGWAKEETRASLLQERFDALVADLDAILRRHVAPETTTREATRAAEAPAGSGPINPADGPLQ